MRQLLVVALFATLMPSSASAQWPPERTRNLKVIPSDIPIRALIDTMAAFTRALGVRCTYCHVGREQDPIESYDFAADDKAPKVKARAMLRMVQAINNEHLTTLADRRDPRMVVTCATCHHGVAEPRPLQQLLLTAYDAAGADSAEAAYRSLRTRYYGRAAYDFGEVPLADMGTALRRRGRLADAVRFYVLNTEFVPASGFAHRQAAEGHLAVADTASAIASLQRALAINPNDPQAKPRLEGLRPKK
ncbi:MAG: c-type cytochrome [Gemmatimonadota bacterium]